MVTPIPQIDLKAQHRSLREELMRVVESVVESSQFVMGPQVEELEAEVARIMGCEHGIGLNSGTDALVLALHALGVGPGTEVVTTPFTFVATVEMVAELGARPVLADIEPDTLNLDVDAAAAAITPKTRVLLPVHLYGQSADLERLVPLARSRGLGLVEDAAQAIGATHHGRPVGSFGDAACLSFFPTKNLGACGDAGMITTPDGALAEKVRLLRAHGSKEKYRHVVVGRNSRLDTLQAAILLVKLKKLESWNEARRDRAAIYRELLAGLPVRLPVERPENRHVYHQFTVRTRRRDELARFLQERGIGTAVHYPIPLHLQPAFLGLGYPRGAFPISERAADQVLSLPVYPELTRADQERVASALAEGTRALGLDGEGPPD